MQQRPTVYRYIFEALDLLAATAPALERVVCQAARLLGLILDRTLISIDRVAAYRPYYSGKHKRHGVNIQVLADTRGRLLWASPALPGAVHDAEPDGDDRREREGNFTRPSCPNPSTIAQRNSTMRPT